MALDDVLGALPFAHHRYSALDLALADGAAVSSWAEHSGGAAAVQASGTKQPLYEATSLIDGGPAVRFDGTDDSLQVNSLASTLFGGLHVEHTIFVVAAPADVVGVRTLVAAGRSSSATPFASYRLNGDKWSTARRGNSNESLNLAFDSTASTPDDTPAIFAGRFRRREISGWVNGAGPGLDNNPQVHSTLTVDRLSIGSLLRNSEAGYWQGDIAEVILVEGALSDAEMNEVEAELGALYGLAPAARPVDTALHLHDLVHGYAVPATVVEGGDTIVGGIRSDGMVVVGRLGDPERASLWKFSPDDHNTPALVSAPGQVPIAFFNEHTGSVLQWRRGVTEGDWLTWGARQTMNPSRAGQVAYSEAFTDGTNIWVFARVDHDYWHFWKSTDWGASFGASVELLDFGTNNQGYMLMRPLADGRIRAAVFGHPISSSYRSIYYFKMDPADTGNITLVDGTVIGNLDGTNLPLTPDDLDLAWEATAGVGASTFDVSDAPDPEIGIAVYSLTNPNDTTYGYVHHDGSDWATHLTLGPAGASFDQPQESHAHGRISFPASSPGGVLLLSREDSGVWTIEHAVTTDGGANFDLTVLETGPAGHLYIRPVAGAAGDPHPLIYVDATEYEGYTDFEGDIRASTGGGGETGSGSADVSAAPTVEAEGSKSAAGAASASAEPTTATTGAKHASGSAAVSASPAVATAGTKGASGTTAPTVEPSVVTTGSKAAAGSAAITANPTVVTTGGSVEHHSGSASISATPTVTASGSKGAHGIAGTASNPTVSTAGAKHAAGTSTATASPAVVTVGVKKAFGTVAVSAWPTVTLTGATDTVPALLSLTDRAQTDVALADRATTNLTLEDRYP